MCNITPEQIKSLIKKYENKIKSIEHLKNRGSSTWGSEGTTKENIIRLDTRIYERKSFMNDLKNLLNEV
jgi:hypothetical protein